MRFRDYSFRETRAVGLVLGDRGFLFRRDVILRNAGDVVWERVFFLCLVCFRCIYSLGVRTFLLGRRCGRGLE